jgi:hypothetical protein
MPEMADHTRPLLIGYFQEIFFATPADKAAIRDRLIGFATREGYTLDSILCQSFDQQGPEFERLIALAKFHGVSNVVVSAPADLSPDQRVRLEAEAGAHVLVAPPP